MVNYNIDTDIRKNILICIFVLSIIVGNFLKARIGKLLIFLNIQFTNIQYWISVIPTQGLFAIMYKIFDKHLWKWSFFNKYLGIPNLNGKWKGIYYSNFKCSDPSNCSCKFSNECNPKTKGIVYDKCLLKDKCEECPNYIKDGIQGDVNFTITQTFTRISIKSKHEKSTSRNRTTSMLLANKPDGEMTLLYEHLNEIDIFKSDFGMKNHSGFNELNYSKVGNKEILSGIYYNDYNRQTYGKICYEKIK